MVYSRKVKKVKYIIIVYIILSIMVFSKIISAQDIVTFQDCKDCPKMVVVETGIFVMFEEQGIQKKKSSCQPHKKRIRKAFAIGIHEVTVEQYAKFINETGYVASHNCSTMPVFEDTKPKDWRNPGFKQEISHPVVCVNWNDIQAYIEYLTKKTGRRYRLPSEAEWEWCARHGLPTLEELQKNPGKICEYGNIADSFLKSAFPEQRAPHGCSDGYTFTSPAISFKPNSLGVYGLLGNVSEFTQSCLPENFDYSGASEKDEIYCNDCEYIVVRGPGWNSGGKSVRITISHGVRKECNSGSNTDGFRVVADIE